MRITSREILNGPIGPILLRMTTPLVMGILVMILFQAVDTYYVGLLGTVELAAISFTFPVTFTISNLAVGLSIATSVLLANVIGKGELAQARRNTTDSLLLVMLVMVIVSVIGIVTIDPLFRQLGATQTTLPLIQDYMGVWYMGVVFIAVPMVANAAIRATGDTKSPSQLMILAGFMNAVLDPILIFGIGPIPSLGVKGAAIASVLSWLLAFGIAMRILYSRERLIVLNLAPLAELRAYWGRVARIGLPISLANMLTPVSAAIVTALIARYGEHAVAGFGAGSRVEALFVVVPIAMTASLSPYLAQNIGAGNIARARSALKLALKFVLCFQIALWPLIGLASPWLARIFSDDPAVLSVTEMFLWIMPLGLGFFGALIVINTAFNSAHQSGKTLLCNVLRLILFYTPCAWLGGWMFDIPGLFVGSVIGNILAAWFAWWLFTRTYDALEFGPGTSGVVDPAEAMEGPEFRTAPVD